MSVRRTVLPSGLRIVTEEVPSVRSAAIGIWVNVGSRDEAPAVAGASHFLEHLLFKGTTRRNALEISATIEAVGGEMNAFTSKEYTCFYARVIDTDLPIAIDVVSDLITSSIVSALDVDAERKVVLEEIAMRDDDPSDLVHDLYAETYYGDTQLGRPILGTIKSITDMTRGSVFNYYKKKEFGAMVNRALGSMQEGITEIDGQIIYQAGTPQLKIEKEREKDSFYKPEELTDRLWFPQIVLRDVNLRDPSEEVKFGNQFHLLLAQANKSEELDEAIDSLLETGQITRELEPLLRVKATTLLNNPQYQDLVGLAIKTKSEPWILVSESETKRPDKLFIHPDKIVVIDFKTGLRKDKDHHQITAYKQLLEEMMHLPVDSFLYYTNDGELVAC